MSSYTDALPAGLACPACGNTEEFEITTAVAVTITRGDGVISHGEVEFDDATPCYCGIVACGYAGDVGDFIRSPIGVSEKDEHDEEK